MSNWAETASLAKVTFLPFVPVGPLSFPEFPNSVKLASANTLRILVPILQSVNIQFHPVQQVDI